MAAGNHADLAVDSAVHDLVGAARKLGLRYPQRDHRRQTSPRGCLAMITGVLKIELLPSSLVDSADVRPRLRAVLHEASSLYGTVAYWTTPFSFVSRTLPTRLASPGFLCVDIHLPTDLDRLNELHAAGASIHLHLRDMRANVGDKATGMPPHLLHAKMLLFDFPDGEAELWTGSHNWTIRALAGPNVECSLVVRLSQNSPLYAQARQFLQGCRSLCQPFDPTQLAWYKRLQLANDPTDRTIDLEGEDVQNLDDTVIAVFGTEPKDLQELKTLGRNVYVQLADSSTEEETLYSATVIHVGEQPRANPSAGGLLLSPRRYAFRLGKRLAVLEPIAQIPDSVLSRAYYFASLELGSRVSGKRAYAPVAEERWEVSTDSDPLLQRSAQEVRERLSRGTRPAMRVPAAGASEDREYRLEPLYEKRNRDDMSLVRRKLIR